MKKLIFITNYFGNGGAAMVIKSIITELQYSYNIMLISFRDDENKYDIPDNVEYVKLNDKIDLTEKELINSMFNLRKIIRKESDSVIITFEYFINMRVIMSLFGLHKKIIISERNDPARVGSNHKYLRNILYMFANTLVCQTEDAKNYFPKYIQKKSVVILNPLKENLPAKYIGEREKVIVNFCRLEKQKNLLMLIDAFKLINKNYPDYKLYIYGDGTEKEKLVSYINKSKLEKSVFIYPFDNKIHEKIRTYTMYVSSSDYEGLSNSMLEAMAIGLPTICTDCPCGGAKMIISDGVNGFLTDVGNAKMLSDKMKKIIESKELQTKFSNNAIKLVEELSVKNIVKKWVELF